MRLQAQPHRNAWSHMPWAIAGAPNAAPGRPKQVQPPRGAESYTQWANVGAH
jgi:hypothetical protein